MSRLAKVLKSFLVAMTRAMEAEDIPRDKIDRVRNRLIYGNPIGPKAVIRLDQFGNADSKDQS